MKKIYLKKNADEIKYMENKYNFIPNETSVAAISKSMDKVCLKTTKDIAMTKEKFQKTEHLEEILHAYREYAVKKISKHS